LRKYIQGDKVAWTVVVVIILLITASVFLGKKNFVSFFSHMIDVESKVYLGIEYKEGFSLPSVVTEKIWKETGILSSIVIKVSRVVPGSPAATVGILSGDMIFSIDGKPDAGDPRFLDNYLKEKSPGDKIDVYILRNDQIKKFPSVVLSKKP